MAWPNPARPGEPADLSRAWHWVTRRDDGGMASLPLGWNAAAGHWVVWDGASMAPEEAARRFHYLGPCLTPAEVAAMQAAPVTTPSEPEPPRGLAALAASATPPPPPAMVYRRDAIRNHLLIFAGTLFGTLFLAEKVTRK